MSDQWVPFVAKRSLKAQYVSQPVDLASCPSLPPSSLMPCPVRLRTTANGERNLSEPPSSSLSSRTFFISRATIGGGQPLVQSMAPRTRNVLPLLAASLKMKRIFSVNQCRFPGLLNLRSLKDILSDPESFGNHGAIAEMMETTLQSLSRSSANWLLRMSRIMTTPGEKTAA
jgi:hypothetical protein